MYFTESAVKTLEAISYIVTIVGFPVAIFALIYEKQKERKLLEQQSYLTANDKYIEFLNLCLSNPDLDIFDISIKEQNEYLKEDKKSIDRELISFSILISIWERAFLFYQTRLTEKSRQEWLGWESYISDYCKRDNFLIAWKILGQQFNPDFECRINIIIEKVTPQKLFEGDEAQSSKHQKSGEN